MHRRTIGQDAPSTATSADPTGPEAHGNPNAAPSTRAAWAPPWQATTTDLRHQLVHDVAHALRRVTGTHAYLDTVGLLFREYPSHLDLSALRRENNGNLVAFGPTHHLEYRYSLLLHQPTDVALSYILSTAPKHAVNRLDLAYDWTMPTQRDAKQLQGLFKYHLTQPWRSKHRAVTHVSSTDYYARPWQRRNIAMYADKPSKITGEPCTHVELRFYSKPVCQPIAPTIAAIRRLDPEAIFHHHCRLSFIPWRRVGKLIDAMAGTRLHRLRGGTTRADLRRQIIENICDHLSADTTSPPVQPHYLGAVRVQDWIDRLRIPYPDISASTESLSTCCLFDNPYHPFPDD